MSPVRPATPLLLSASVAVSVTALAACSRGPQAPRPAADPVAVPAAPVVPAAAPGPVSYDRDIRPILSDKCFYCHGTDAKTREAGLRLDTAEGARAALKGGGGHALVPGEPGRSALWERVNAPEGSDDLMPPAKSGKARLSPAESELLKRWIEEGAAYEAHWSFEAPAKPAPPAVKDAAWCRNEVDRFILAKLEEKGLAPAPEAGKAALLRRVSLDLTGLPPTPEEYDAFLADPAPDAYEKQVRRLLDSPRFGERMASYWCDAARYADTVGMHADEYHDYYRWRDWVVRQMNANLPFDKFLTDCLAGDLVEKPTQENLLGSIFVRLNPVSTEGGAIDQELRVEYAADRVDVLGTALLGLSLKCARCHDHKFDPVTQEDFYSLFAYFNSIEEQGLWAGGTRNQPVFGTSIALEDPAFDAEVAGAKRKVDALKAEIQEAKGEAQGDLAGWRKDLLAGAGWAGAALEKAEATGGVKLAPQPDGSVLSGGPVPQQSVTTLTLRTDATDLRLLRLDALTDPSLPRGGAGRAGNGNACLSFIEAEAVSVKDPAQRRKIRLVAAWADYEQAGGDFDILNALRPDPACWAIGGHVNPGPRTALFLADAPFGFAGGTRVRVKLHYASPHGQHELGRVRVDLGAAAPRAAQAAAPSWMLCGPFPASSYAQAFADPAGPEEGFDPAAVLEGGAAWQNRPDFADGLRHELAGANAAFYLARVVAVERETRSELRIAADGGLKVFLDGREVFAREKAPAPKAGPDTVPVTFAPGVHLLMLKVVNGGGKGGFKFEAPGLEFAFPGAALALVPEANLPPAQAQRLAEAYADGAAAPALAAARTELRAAEQALAQIEARRPRALVTRELPTPRPTFILHRGEYDKPEKDHPVSRRPLRIGKVPTEGLPANRLGLAQWMTHPDHPLTARVMVNRFWQLFFVHGLCKTSEDLGLQGEYPPNLPLLDFLAVRFREEGWDVKKTLERIVTSATYRQDSTVRPEALKLDPENRLLASFPRQRLPAEAVRDQALMVSGLLVEKVGGRAVKTYQPGGLWEVMALRGAPDEVTNYRRDTGEALYRRSLYTFWKRGCTPAQMVIFDGQDRGACTVRRPTTNTPLQALMLWNDPQFLEAARHLAARTLAEETDADARLARAFRRCTGRAPQAADLAPLRRLLDAALARYAADPQAAKDFLAETGESPLPTEGPAADPATLAAWTCVGSALLSLDETLVRD